MADWVSAETERKEQHFRGILGMHVTICKGIFARSTAKPYLYADLYAGPGNLEYRGRHFLGSPLIAQEILAQSGVPYEALHYEKDSAVAARLAEALWVPTSLLDRADETTSPVFAESCQEGFSRWLSDVGPQVDRYGLVYADPICDEIPHALLNRAAQAMPRVDLLSYVAATQYKRRRGQDIKRNGGSDRPLLAGHVAAVKKSHALIRRPAGGNQYTFILWTNWEGFPQWESAGFYRLDSDTGKNILDRLNLTGPEFDRSRNTPLPFDPEQPPYRSYAEYLRHPRFRAIRARVFERARGACERCEQRPPTEPHHLRYPPWGTFDVPENMIAVCHQCHCEIHGKAN